MVRLKILSVFIIIYLTSQCTSPNESFALNYRTTLRRFSRRIRCWGCRCPALNS